MAEATDRAAGGASDAERGALRRAVKLAVRGQGRVEPNPMVGAVLLRDGRAVAEGWHGRFGGPHAEVACLADARSKGVDPAGLVMAVTLEPCCHTGKTGPCTGALREAKVGRVVVGALDPSPHAAGRGVAELRAAGVDVVVLEDEAARELIAPFAKRVTTGLPWVIAKWAQTLDGKTATAGGDSKWISGEASRRLVHRLRARVDAVMVGVGTVVADDPKLTARGVPVRRVARRVVVDPGGQTPEQCDVRRAPAAWIVTRAEAPTLADGSLDLSPVLRRLAAEGATNVLAEGGATLTGHLLKQGLVDELLVFVAPKVVGDDAARGAVRGLGVALMKDALQWTLRGVKRVGEDVMLTYRRVEPRG